MPRGCKVCRYFQSGNVRYQNREKEEFEKRIREGRSLKELAQYLEFCGLKTSRSTVRNHIEHLDYEIKSQRLSEIEQKSKNPLRKLRNIFTRPKIETIPKCKHLRTESFWDISRECVRCKCVDCGKVLEGFSDPNSDSRWKKTDRDYKSQIILEAFS